MADEELEDRTNLDKVLRGDTGRYTTVIPFGLAQLHEQSKVEFSDTDTQSSVTISPYTELKDYEDSVEEDINYINANPDSFYVILAHNQSSQAVTLRVLNEWEDVDGDSRQTEITDNGHVISSGSSDIIPVEGLFCGNNSVIQGEIDSQEGSSWNLYVNVYRP